MSTQSTGIQARQVSESFDVAERFAGARPHDTTGNERLTVATIVVADLMAVFVAKFLVLVAGAGATARADHFVPASLEVAAISLFVLASAGLYPGVLLHPAEELRRVAMAAGITALIASGLQSARWLGIGSLLATVGFWIAMSTSTFLARALVRSAVGRCTWWGIPVVVLGGGPSGRTVVNRMGRGASALKVAAWLDEETLQCDETETGPHALGGVEEIVAFAARSRITHAVLVMAAVPPGHSLSLVRQCRTHFRCLLLIPELAGLPSISVQGTDVAGLPCILLRQGLLSASARCTKRLIDIVLCVAIGLPALPMIAAICLAIRCSSKGPLFYKQKRIGFSGREFMVWKFRSMVLNADDLLQTVFMQNPDYRREWETDHKLRHDPRLTWIGRILRKSSLDELPQLWNILRGDMSFVGPRPIVETETHLYGGNMFCYKQVRPGVTGLWQVSGRNNTSYPQRVEYDTFYVRNWSVWLDIYICWRTIRTVLTGEGAY